MKAIKNIMIALSGIALLASCDMDKFFELDRPESNPWLSVDDLEYSVADPYNTLFQNPNWQAPIGIIPYYQELVADLSTVNPQGAYEQEALYWYPRQMSTFTKLLAVMAEVPLSACALTYSIVRFSPSTIPSSASPCKNPSRQLSKDPCTAYCIIPMV